MIPIKQTGKKGKKEKLLSARAKGSYGTTMATVEKSTLDPHGQSGRDVRLLSHRISINTSDILMLIHQEKNEGSIRRYHLRRCLSHQTLTTNKTIRSYMTKEGLSQEGKSLLDLNYPQQAQVLLSSVDKWSFNIFLLERLTDGHSLYFVVQKLFLRYGFYGKLKVDSMKLIRFIKLVEEGYHVTNPYHNSTHAADVVQAMHYNIRENKLMSFLDDEEKMASILSAACHDLDHPGVNQNFLIHTSNPLAQLYHNTSVLENHHYRSSLSLLRETKLLCHLSAKSWKVVNDVMMTTILATDITRQQQILEKFKQQLDVGSMNLKDSGSNRNFILQIALKCADICNPCRQWPVCYQWSEMICEEFFRQGDCEYKLNLPVVPPFDRSKSTIASVQTGFIQFIVEPLFDSWHRFTQSSSTQHLMDLLARNKKRWKKSIEENFNYRPVDVYLRNQADVFPSEGEDAKRSPASEMFTPLKLNKNKHCRSTSDESDCEVDSSEHRCCGRPAAPPSHSHSVTRDIPAADAISTQARKLTRELSQEDADFWASFCSRRRHSMPMTSSIITSAASSPITYAVRSAFQHSAKLASLPENSSPPSPFSSRGHPQFCSAAQPATDSATASVHASSTTDNNDLFLEQLKAATSCRRASFPLNVSIVQDTAADDKLPMFRSNLNRPSYESEKCAFLDQSRSDFSKKFILTGFLSSLYVTAVINSSSNNNNNNNTNINRNANNDNNNHDSINNANKYKKKKTRSISTVIPVRGDIWPTNMKGVLGFGSQDRMTALFNSLLTGHAKKASVDVINESTDFGQSNAMQAAKENPYKMILLTANRFVTSNIFS